MPGRPVKIAGKYLSLRTAKHTPSYTERPYGFTKIDSGCVASELNYDRVYLLPSQKRQCSGVGVEDVGCGSATEKRASSR